MSVATSIRTLIVNAILGASVVAAEATYYGPPKHGGVYVIAHRGAHHGIPENTLSAYEKAIQLGADFVEIDLRTTKDGEFVSIHNDTVDAYVIDGTRARVRDLTLRELRSLDIGVRLGPRWKGQRVPTLNEILELCKDKIGIYLDLKDGSIETVARRIKDCGMQRQVVWCISPNDVDALRAACPKCIPMPDPESEKTLPRMLERTKPTIVAPVWSDFSATFADTCHNVGALVFVDERESTQANWQQALDWGADGIQTDDPAKLIAFLCERDRRRTQRTSTPPREAVQVLDDGNRSRRQSDGATGESLTVSDSIGLAAQPLDLSQAVVIVRPGELPSAEMAAATVLIEELETRSGIRLGTTSEWTADKTVIAITSVDDVPAWGVGVPGRDRADIAAARPEGFRLLVDKKRVDEKGVVWVIGEDPRGALYGVGALLRHLDWDDGQATLPADLDIATAPSYPIRGHQLGFRTQANSWDAWTPAQFDQYIRELALFGINSVENIPFHDDRPTPVMKVSRCEMNRRMSEICARYGLDYWVWTPADYDLADAEIRAKALDDHGRLYRDCRELTGVFFPGGDPGENTPQLVLPFLKDIADRLLSQHPDARVWLSMQWYNREQITYIVEYLEQESPDWLGGLVAGPSSPPIPMTRDLLPKRYKYRLYPDITHNKICQYPVPWWDQAFALTLGRESINPRPAHYTYIHNWFAPFSDGFISYSDGVHDDVNKTIWSSLSWEPATNPRDVLVEYCRVFFHSQVAEEAADGILALENNWRGSLRDNGAVEGTLLYWQQLEQQMPQLEGNWRWQMCLVRAYYDAYIRRRLLNECRLETAANLVLSRCESLGAEDAIARATTLLNRAVEEPIGTELRSRIFELCEKLYHSCGLQTSVSKYHASGGERGAFLDYVDYPLNNRWWLEDEFKKVRNLTTEAERRQRLIEIAQWETPPAGSFYDDVGNPAKSPHVRRHDSYVTMPREAVNALPTRWWWNEGKSRARLSWQTTMNYPEAVVYEGLDSDASYTVRMSGYGKFLLRVDGDLIGDADKRIEMGEVQDIRVPDRYVRDRRLVLTWDRPTDEGHLNWRQHSRLAEVWLLRQ